MTSTSPGNQQRGPSTPLTIGNLQAFDSVFRVHCADTFSNGTCFMHKSGRAITAAHVVVNSSKVFLVFPNLHQMPARIEAIDRDLDLAVLAPAGSITLGNGCLPISSPRVPALGTQVTTWGFPAGFSGPHAIVSVGYLASAQKHVVKSGATVMQWCVNAAFNSGNSGGPLIEVDTGEVIGVVSSKLAPISAFARAALSALETQANGFQYTVQTPDGQTKMFSEGQMVAAVLNELREQVQLVIGMAAMSEDLRNFLQKNGIAP